MGKFILALLVGLVAYFAIRSLKRSAQRRHDAATPAAPMVKCHHCGVHLPLSESVGDDLGRFCCEEHRRFGRS